MINFTTPYGPIELPSSYHDLTVKDYNQLKDNREDFVKVLCVLTGLTSEQVQTIDWSPISDYIDFLHEPPHNMEPLNYIKVGDTEIQGIDIWEKEWGQKITGDTAIQSGNLIGLNFIIKS